MYHGETVRTVHRLAHETTIPADDGRRPAGATGRATREVPVLLSELMRTGLTGAEDMQDHAASVRFAKG